ncbi:MAG: DUF2007 domain-containing protein [Bacteroidetes bacterium]|nr:DUF2007 domain-containing protein [Bacteroidota bacterium]
MILHNDSHEEIDDHWEMVFSTPQLYRVEILKSLLEEEGIPSVIINKQSSAYIMIGEIELHVKREDILNAKLIINQSLNSE